MKSLVIALALAVVGFFMLAPASANAYDVINHSGVCSKAPGSAACQDNSSSKTDPLTGSNGLILKVSRIIAVAAGIVAVIMIIVGGFKFIVSGGEAQAVASAKKTILFSVVGLIVIALSETIFTFIVGNI